MADVEVDGTMLRSDGPSIALSVSDVLGPDGALERLTAIVGRTSAADRLRFVCVRNDSMDPGLFSATAALASSAGLGVILESPDPVCLAAAVEALPGRRPLMCLTDPGRLVEAAVLSGAAGAPLAVPGDDVQSLMDNAETAWEYGAAGIVLNPSMRNMKACLETCTDIRRLGSEHGIGLAAGPLMTRTWSGEYALSVASVSVMRGGDLIVADDLDSEACRVLDALMGCIRQLD